MTWSESVDEALCFGWIDGVRRSLGRDAYTIRFTPRKSRSQWSDVNLRKFDMLEEQGRMTDAGRAARAAGIKSSYSYESAPKSLTSKFESYFQSNERAWIFFRSQPPSYTNVAIHWIMTAKQEETQKRRLQQTIEYSEKGERLPHLRPSPR